MIDICRIFNISIFDVKYFHRTSDVYRILSSQRPSTVEPTITLFQTDSSSDEKLDNQQIEPDKEEVKQQKKESTITDDNEDVVSKIKICESNLDEYDYNSDTEKEKEKESKFIFTFK